MNKGKELNDSARNLLSVTQSILKLSVRKQKLRKISKTQKLRHCLQKSSRFNLFFSRCKKAGYTMPHRRFSVLSDSEPEEQNANIIIPDFLRQRVNFLQSPCAGAPDYEVSPMARHYFRKHSNIMTLLDEYMVGRSPMPDIELLPRMIRFAVSLPGKRVFKPLKEFRFESIYHEAIAKILLTYPLIKDEATLHLYLKFQNKHCLKLPFVDMLQNYAVHSDGVKHFFEDDASDDDNDVSSTREDENRSNSTTSMAVSRCSSETSPSLRIPLARLLDENILPKTVISNLKGTPAAQSTPHEQKNSVNLVASTNLRSPRTRNQAQPNVSPKTRVQVQQNPSEAGPSSQSLEKVVQKQPKLLPDFYVDEDETCLSYDCIKVLLADEMFTSQAKHHLKDKFSKHFDIFWHSKSHVILKRFIIDLWSNDMEALANLVGKCQKNTIVKTLEILDKHMKNQEKAAGLSLGMFDSLFERRIEIKFYCNFQLKIIHPTYQ